MQRKKVKEFYSLPGDCFNDKTVTQILATLEKVQRDCADAIGDINVEYKWDHSYYDYSEVEEITFIYQRWETDKEFEKRKAAAEKRRLTKEKNAAKNAEKKRKEIEAEIQNTKKYLERQKKKLENLNEKLEKI